MVMHHGPTARSPCRRRPVPGVSVSPGQVDAASGPCTGSPAYDRLLKSAFLLRTGTWLNVQAQLPGGACLPAAAACPDGRACTPLVGWTRAPPRLEALPRWAALRPRRVAAGGLLPARAFSPCRALGRRRPPARTRLADLSPALARPPDCGRPRACRPFTGPARGRRLDPRLPALSRSQRDIRRGLVCPACCRPHNRLGLTWAYRPLAPASSSLSTAGHGTRSCRRIPADQPGCVP